MIQKINIALLISLFALTGLRISDAVTQSANANPTCISIFDRITTDVEDRPYSNFLLEECVKAALAEKTDKGNFTARYASELLESLGELEGALHELKHSPNRYGEYLIAREIGVHNTLYSWIRIQEMNAEKPKASILSKIANEPEG